MWFPAKTPKVIKSLFPKFIWNIDTSKKALYLTFDDGPTPNITTWVLEQLRAYNAKATFFCIGNNIEKHSKIFNAIIDNGHSVGNHSYNHLNGWKTNTTSYLKNVDRCQSSISTFIQNSDYVLENLYRPPYGKLKPAQAKQIRLQGYKIIMWDVLSYDWDASVSEKQCFKNVTESANKGSIIVFHDSYKAERNLKSVLPKVLKFYSEKGFEFRNLNQTYS